MKRTLICLTLLALTLQGCTKFLPSAMHRRSKTTPPAAAATSGSQQPAVHVAPKGDTPSATSASKPATMPASHSPSATSAEHRS